MFWSLNPHKAPVWMNCAGSAQLESVAPRQEPGQPRLEGDAAHEVAMKILRGEAQGVEEFINTNASNGVFIDAVMADHVQTYVDYVHSVPAQSYIEVPLQLTPNIKGVNDHFAVKPGIFYGTELKFGWSPVEVKKNWQLIVEALMAASYTGGPIREYQLTVVQPRAPHKDGPIRHWTVTADEMEDYRTQILDQEDIAMEPGAPLVTGDHCHHCEAKGICPALKNTALRAVETEGKAIAEELTPAELAYELAIMDAAEKRIKDRHAGLKTIAETMIKGGTQVPNYGIEPQYGNRVWKRGVTPATIMMVSGVDIAQEKMMTPSQAERAGVSKETVKAYTTRTISSHKLIAVDVQEKAKELFGNE